ncbi:MAG: hypothetical protein IJM59_02795 [Proteobacteria bacterium]|nr:hypothetical protein [Pseudomonadota bacterium]
MKLKHLILGFVLVFVMFSTGGCRLIFEPDVDAVDRMFASMPTGDNRVVRELCDNEKVCSELYSLGGIVRSDWYANKKNYYEFEQVEIAEDTGYSYVHVKVRLPGNGGRDATMFPLIFEMERVKLRWHIYSVEGLGEFLRRANRARGIL